MPVLGTNTSANSALIYLNQNSRAVEKSLARLASGSRIVRASDDAAGLAVATKLKSDVTVLKQASTNAIQARSVIQTADGALARIGDILQRMKALTAQANSGSVDATARGFINTEFVQLRSEIDAIADATTFNGSPLINGSYNQNYQVGVAASNVISVDFSGLDANIAALGIGTSTVDTVANAVSASTALDTAINSISSYRATAGSLLSRFEYRGAVIDDAIENLTSAVSAIMDVDIAAEQSYLVSRQVLMEASIAALAQANQMKSSLLALMR